MARCAALALFFVVACGPAAPPPPRPTHVATTPIPSDKPEPREGAETPSGEQRRQQMFKEADTYASVVAANEQRLGNVVREILGRPTARDVEPRAKLSSAIRDLRAAGLRGPMLVHDSATGYALVEKNQNAKAWGDAASHVVAISTAAYALAESAIVVDLRAMMQVAAVALNRRQYGLEPADVDVETAQKALAVARRGDFVAAAAATLAATMKGVMDGSGAPNALDDVAETIGNALPLEAKVAPAEAKTLVDGFAAGTEGLEDRYSGWLKDVYRKDWDGARLREELEGVWTMLGPRRPTPADAGSKELPSDAWLRKTVNLLAAVRKADAKGTVKAASAIVTEGPLKSALARTVEATR